MEAHSSRTESKTWQAYRNALLRFVRGRVNDAAAAEDIVQDVLVKAYTRRGTLREPSRLREWLYQITRNEVIDYYRSYRRLEAVPDDLAQEDPRGADGDARQELARCLVPMLNDVPEPYRRALQMADFDGIRQREVAARLGLSLSGAKSRVQRARRMLRDVLFRCCRVELDRRGHAVDFEAIEGGSNCSRRDC